MRHNAKLYCKHFIAPAAIIVVKNRSIFLYVRQIGSNFATDTLNRRYMQELDKKYYKIGDVAAILGIPMSTLRYWESQFTIIKPKRNAKNIRFYTPNDIEIIRKVYYLVKEKGLKLDAAQEQIRVNRDGVDKRFEVVEKLKEIKSGLLELQHALDLVRQE